MPAWIPGGEMHKKHARFLEMVIASGKVLNKHCSK